VTDFDDFVASNSRRLLRSAWLLTGNWSSAEDLVQIALLSTWRRWDQVELELPFAYTRRVLVNSYLSGRRRRWRDEWSVAEVPETAGSYADDLAGADLRESLRSALAALPSKQRAAVVLRYFEDLSEPQTAQLLGCSVGNVKSQTSRALAKLRVTPGLRSLLQEASCG
jgi:RNA polymerase sigma-70 factor (sigma-E family)